MIAALLVTLAAASDAAADRATVFVARAAGAEAEFGGVEGPVLLGLTFAAVVGIAVALIATARYVSRGRDASTELDTLIKSAGGDDV